MKKITITAPMAHFKIPYASKLMLTYPIPPLSTVYGMLKVIYGEDIDNFKFGYIFESQTNVTDLVTVYKVNQKSTKDIFTDCIKKEYLVDCLLTIYTDINKNEQISYCLTMGRSNCLAKIMTVENIELTDNEGYIINQWTPLNIGTGTIYTITNNNVFNHTLNSFDSSVAPYRLNMKKVNYNKNFDESIQQNVFLHTVKDKEVISDYDKG